MAHYAIGDLQGCYHELSALLNQIDFNHGTDTLWLTGDIINRGPNSLACLQFAMSHESSVQTVLGNHDLHLLAVSYGEGRLKKSDTLQAILQHPHRQAMLDWLRQQPLLIKHEHNVMVHAGVLPEWTVSEAAAYAHELEYALQHNPHHFFANMYGNTPSSWDKNLNGSDRLRFIANVFTRMRALTFSGALDYRFKSTLADMPTGLRAWFESPNRRQPESRIIFGHWSALGYFNARGVVCLDTGALWGGKLTAFNLDNGSISQISSNNHLNWK